MSDKQTFGDSLHVRSHQVRILFITRKYPPSIGGMQSLSAELAREFQSRMQSTIISWGRSQALLPWFLLLSFVKSAYAIWSRKIERVHLGDGVLAPFGLLLKLLFGTRTTITVHGRDITFGFKPYQYLIPRCLARLDKVICVSQATLEECVMRRVMREKCVVIPNGVHPENFVVDVNREDLKRLLGMDLRGKEVLLTVGRLVKRKGVHWFIQSVVPHLDSHIIYVVAGDGPDRDRVKDLIEALDLRDRVLLLGQISDEDLKILYNTADLFVMPNMAVLGDMEGFGIVAIEAASAGLPVVASNLEGIKDAVLEGQTGYLVEPESVQEFQATIMRCLAIGPQSKQSIMHAVVRNYGWDALGARYVAELRSTHDTALIAIAST